MRPGFKSRRRRHMWVKFVVGSLLCSKRFFSGYSGFLLSSKTNIFKFQFDQESGRRRTTLWMCYLQIVIYIIYIIYYLCNVTKFLLYLHFLTGNCTVMKPTTSRTHSVRDPKKGRSGRRGDHTSYCYLITSPSSVEASL